MRLRSSDGSVVVGWDSKGREQNRGGVKCLWRAGASGYTWRQIRTVRGEKNIFSRNALQIVIFMALPPYPLPKYMTGGSGMRGAVTPIWVRKFFKKNSFFIIYRCKQKFETFWNKNGQNKFQQKKFGSKKKVSHAKKLLLKLCWQKDLQKKFKKLCGQRFCIIFCDKDYAEIFGTT